LLKNDVTQVFSISLSWVAINSSCQHPCYVAINVFENFNVIIEKADGNYSAYSPDLPGCVATGPTVKETILRMRDAIQFHIKGLER